MNANTDMDSAGQVLDLSISKSGKSRLARAVVGLLKLSIILGGPIMTVDSTWADTGDLDTVTTTWEWENPEFFDPWDYVWYPEGGGGGSGDDGSGSGGDGEPVPLRSCDELRATKPASCPNPIPMPSGYGYGRELYASGRAIPRVINFVENQPYVHPDAREWARLALQFQTEHFTDGTTPYDYSSRTFLSLLTAACRVQNREDQGVVLPGNNPTTDAERACLDALSAATAETQNDSFFSFFNWWSEKEGVSLSSIGVPAPLVSFLSPQNSIRVKYDAVSADAKCSTWWSEVQVQQCSL